MKQMVNLVQQLLLIKIYYISLENQKECITMKRRVKWNVPKIHSEDVSL